MENHRNFMKNPRKPGENHGKSMKKQRKPLNNHRKPMEPLRFHCVLLCSVGCAAQLAL